MERQLFNEQLAMIEHTIANEKADELAVSSIDSMFKELKAMPPSAERQDMIIQFQRLLLRQTAYELNRWLRYNNTINNGYDTGANVTDCNSV